MSNNDKADVYALLSLICAVLGCIGFGIIGGGTGLIFAIKAKRLGAETTIQKTGMILSVAVIIISVMVFVVISNSMIKLEVLEQILEEIK